MYAQTVAWKWGCMMRLGCVGKGSGREDVLYSFPTHDRAVGSGSLPVLTKEADCALPAYGEARVG